MSAAELPTRRTLVIVIVEDSLTQLLHLQHTLEKHGHRVIAARDGSDALERISAAATPPDLVITDINMPNMDGYGLCQRVKDDPALRETPVILLTSLSDPKDILKGLECGADSFIVKPYDEELLLSRIYTVIANHELRHNNGGTEIFFAGRKYQLNPGRTHSLDLLLSTYETAVHKNLELSRAKEALEQTAGELRVKNAEMEADLEMARELQAAFLPRSYPTFPLGVPDTESALGFCHSYRTTTKLGGDFFDILRVSDTEAGVFICDVMGHGVRAALVTAIIRALVEEMAPVFGEPTRFLDEINQSLCAILQTTETPLFASAFYGVIDIATGQLRHANAGHPHPMLLRKAAPTVERMTPDGGKPGAALGVFPNAQYPGAEAKLEPGDFLVLFTDGLYELERAGGGLVTQDQLAAELARIHGEEPCGQLDRLMRNVLACSAEGRFEDDVCIVGVEFRKEVPSQCLHP